MVTCVADTFDEQRAASDSDCRSTALKLDKRTARTCANTVYPQVRGRMRCPLLSPPDPSVPLAMAREWHAKINSDRGAPARESAATAGEMPRGSRRSLL